MDYKITAFDLKLALLEYFRFKRQWICVDEFRGADVVVDTGKDVIEVEVKVSKSDLVNGERRKQWKHQSYKRINYNRNCPNKFYFCVPQTLIDSAQKVCEKLNPKYGIIAFDVVSFNRHIQLGYGLFHSDYICMIRTAKRLHENYSKLQEAIAKRASSKIVSLMKADFKRKLQNSIGA